MKTKVLSLFFICCCYGASVFGQQPAAFTPDTVILPIDSLPLSSDSVRFSVNKTAYSKDSLDATVEYGAKDSINFDSQAKLVYLYGKAYVNYKTLTLKANYIVVDLGKNEASAEGYPDSSGQIAGYPEFADGDQHFDAHKLRYNFQTKKGLISEVTTKQNDIYVLGNRTKFLGKLDTNTNDIAYSQGAIFTTCDDPHPHFGIRSTRQKVIPNKLIVVGPSNLIIGDVPTPLYLPFGFFPITKNKRQGLLFPKDYEFDPNFGFGLRDIGYYIPLGDHFDLTLLAKAYWNGTWGVNAGSNYKKIYKYSGRVEIGYSDQKYENELATNYHQKSYLFTWSHSQDSRAHPTNTFNANINIQTNNYQSRNRNDAHSVLENSLSSNASFNKTFPDKPYTLSSSFNHSQNTRTREVTVNFPRVDFQMQRIFPFKKESRVGKEKWYEKITFQYNGSIKNQFRALDSTLFTNKTLEDAQFGVEHKLSTDAPFRLLKYFTFTPSVSYRETWYFKTTRYQANPNPTLKTSYNYLLDSEGHRIDSTLVIDTLTLTSLDTNFVNGFQPLRLFTTGVSMNTQIFGTLRFKHGWLRGLRHVIKPGFSFNYTPDYTGSGWGYFKTVQAPILPNATRIDSIRYSIFDTGQGFFEQPPSNGRSMAFSYSFNNIFEAKYHSKKDSTDKKIKLFDNINIGGNYNFAADSLNWSPVTGSGTLRLFKGLSTLSLNFAFDPYKLVNGRRVNQLLIKTDGKLLRFTGMMVNISTGMTFKQIRDLFRKPGQEESQLTPAPESQIGPTGTTAGAAKNKTPLAVSDDFLGLFDNFRINHNLSIQRIKDRGVDTLLVVNSLNFQGDIQITRNWKISFGNMGYDFKAKKLTYIDLSFYRDLHCWEMGLSWQPDRGTYSFFLRVKPGSLDFLKIPFNRYTPNLYQF